MAAKFLEHLQARFGRRVNLSAQRMGYRRIAPEVLADLAEFCGAVDPAPRNASEFQQGRAAGRRDVWLRIASNRHLRESEIYALLKGEPIATAEEKYRA